MLSVPISEIRGENIPAPTLRGSVVNHILDGWKPRYPGMTTERIFLHCDSADPAPFLVRLKELCPDARVETIHRGERGGRPRWAWIAHLRRRAAGGRLVIGVGRHARFVGEFEWRTLALLAGGGNAALLWLDGGLEPVSRAVWLFYHTPLQASRVARGLIGYVRMKRRLRNESDRIDKPWAPRVVPDKESLCVAYLRTMFLFDCAAGGSVGHTAGVINALRGLGHRVAVFSTDELPQVQPGNGELRIARPVPRHSSISALAPFLYHLTFVPRVGRTLEAAKPDVIYQRYTADDFCGVTLARMLNVPLVLEFNSSEVWKLKHWGGGAVSRESLARASAVQRLNLKAANLIVVVSEALRTQILSEYPEVAASRILVNPNGVDPDRYSPRVDGNAVREKYGLTGKTVVGFIGTFSQWHGAEVLAEVFARLAEGRPDLARNARLLMIGDGPTLPRVKELLARQEAEGLAVFTGVASQEQGPTYLAACDILVSPHVPNPDGSPFFGSPTKLFEYMAMGKGIVASELEQIGEVLEHDRTAWLVRPGDAEALTEGLRILIEDEALRRRLGEAARREAVAKHTWKEHVRRIVERIR